MRRMPPLAAVRAFEAAARLESFTAAAAELGLTQAAVSYQVKALEDRIRAPLFVRERGRVRLTALGARLLPALSQAFDAVEAAFASHTEEDEQLLTITTTPTFANTWLAWTLGSFQMEHPDLAVRMMTDNAVIDLRSGDADVAIRAGRGEWEGVEKHRLLEVEFTPMASPGCIREAEMKLGRPIEPADLVRLKLISPQDDWWKQWFSEWGGRIDDHPPQTGIRLDNQANEGHAAMAGQGFALMTPFFWIKDIAEGRLVIPFGGKSSRRGWSYWLVYPSERRRVPKVKRFREWLLAAVERGLVREREVLTAIEGRRPEAA